jgi:hypothetical protein
MSSSHDRRLRTPFVPEAIPMNTNLARALLVLLGIVALSYFAFRPADTEPQESSRTATNMHAASGPVRQQVAAAAASRGAWRGLAKSLPQRSILDTGYGPATVTVSDDGHITLNHSRHHLTLEYIPMLTSGAVLWRCTGTPQRDMPLGCRFGN